MAVLTVDSQQLFGAGPSRVEPGPAPPVRIDAGFPGVSGASRLTLGQQVRRIAQTGMLRTAVKTTDALARAALVALTDAIEGLDGTSTALYEGEHTLVTADGITYAHCTLDAFAVRGPINVTGSGTAFVARRAYEAAWIQLQPVAEPPP